MPSKPRRKSAKAKQTQSTINAVRKYFQEGANGIAGLKNRRYILEVANKYKYENGVLYYNASVELDDFDIRADVSDVMIEEALKAMKEKRDVDTSLFVKKKAKSDSWLIVPEETEIDEIITKAHEENNHIGRDALEDMLQQKYLINGLQKRCREVKKKCVSCCMLEKDRVLVLDNHYVYTHVGHRVFVDCAFFVKRNRNIGWVMFNDGLTKYRHCFLIKNKKANTIVKCCKKVVQFYQEYGVDIADIAFVSDNGKEFKCEAVETFIRKYGVQWKYTPAGRPKANGLCERSNKTTKEAIRKHMLQKRSYDWPDIIYCVVDNYNNNIVHSTTKYTPKEVLDGLLPNTEGLSRPDILKLKMKAFRLQEEVMANIAARAKKNDAYKIKKALRSGISIDSGLPIGATVFVSSTKTTTEGRKAGDKFSKKAVVEKDNGNNSYQIRFSETGGYRRSEIPGSVATYYRENLKLYQLGNDDQLCFQGDEDDEYIPDLDDDEDNGFENLFDDEISLDEDVVDDDEDIVDDDEILFDDDEEISLCYASSSRGDDEILFDDEEIPCCASFSRDDVEDYYIDTKNLQSSIGGHDELPPSQPVVPNEAPFVEQTNADVGLTQAPKRRKVSRKIFRGNYEVDE